MIRGREVRSGWRCVLAIALFVGCSDGDPPHADAPPPEPNPQLSTTSDVDSSRVARAQPLDPAPELLSVHLPEAELLVEAPEAEQRLASHGPTAPRIAEPQQQIQRETPQALLSGALKAIASRDLAALARLSRDGERHPALNVDDAAAAQRRFLSPAGRRYWSRIEAAIAAGAYEIHETGDEARIRVQVGGAAGTYDIRLRKEGNEWYLAG